MGRELADGSVLEDRLQAGHHLPGRERLGQVDLRVAEGDVRGLAGGVGEGQTQQARLHGLVGGDDRPQGKAARRPGGRRERLHVLEPGEEAMDGLAGGSRMGGELLRDGLELQLLEERVGGRAVGLLAAQGLEGEGDGHVPAQGGELLREQRRLAVVLQPLAVGGPLHLVRVLQHGFHGSELAHEVLRPLVADPGHPGDVVDRVPHQGEHVHHALRRHSPLLLHGLAVVEGRPYSLAAGVEDRHVVVDELEQVLVSRHHDHLEPLGHRQAGQGGDDVVGLPAGDLEDGHPEDLAHPPHVRDLHGQLVVHPGPVGLVVLVLLVPERLSRRVEQDADALGLLVLQELLEHGGEAVGGVGGKAPAGGEAADRVVGPVELSAAVDEVDLLPGSHEYGL